MFIPKGYFSLNEAINRVGIQRYGETEWIGCDFSDLRGRSVPKEPTQQQHDKAAFEQLLDVTQVIRREFVGTPPRHDDAVPLEVLSDETGGIHRLAPQLWTIDQAATKMVLSQKAEFHPVHYPKLFN